MMEFGKDRVKEYLGRNVIECCDIFLLHPPGEKGEDGYVQWQVI